MSKNLENKIWLSIKEAADVLEISPDLLRRQIKNGTIPSLKLGRIYRVPVKALNEITDRVSIGDFKE